MYKFIDKYGYGEPYIYIHPHKQQIVKQIVDAIPNWVDYLIVFGSAVNATCKQTSDVDLCVIGQRKDSDNVEDFDNLHVDIITHNTVTSFKDSISKNPYSASSDAYNKGVVVYAR